VNCLAGIAPAGAGPAELHAVFVENLRYAAAALSKQAIQIISEVGSENLFVQYDIYHMQIMEGDLAPTMKKNLDHIAHIQLADNPGRNEPGTGEINYPFLFRYLDEIGYRGSIGCEYKPKTTTMEGFGWYEPHTVDA
jgi:hydroxypyruvate isomerase